MSRKKEISEGSQVHKQTTYVASKSTNESRAHYASEPTLGKKKFRSVLRSSTGLE